jgi:uncharacterized membrane protein
MKKDKIFAVIFAIIGLLIAVGPKTIFHVCTDMQENGMPMRCYYTSNVAVMLGIGIMLFTTMFIATKNNTAKFISVAGIIYLSVMALLTPNLLIGMCMMEMEQCRMVTLPALNIISVVSIIIGIIYVVLLIKEKGRKENGNN